MGPNIQVKTCLISACIYNRAIEKGLEVFYDMKATTGVDARAYGVIISGFLRIGELRQAVQLVEDAYGLKTGRRVLSSHESIAQEDLEHVLTALRAAGLYEEVRQLLKKLHAAGVPLKGRLLQSGF